MNMWSSVSEGTSKMLQWFKGELKEKEIYKPTFHGKITMKSKD